MFKIDIIVDKAITLLNQVSPSAAYSAKIRIENGHIPPGQLEPRPLPPVRQLIIVRRLFEDLFATPFEASTQLRRLAWSYGIKEIQSYSHTDQFGPQSQKFTLPSHEDAKVFREFKGIFNEYLRELLAEIRPPRRPDSRPDPEQGPRPTPRGGPRQGIADESQDAPRDFPHPERTFEPEFDADFDPDAYEPDDFPEEDTDELDMDEEYRDLPDANEPEFGEDGDDPEPE